MTDTKNPPALQQKTIELPIMVSMGRAPQVFGMSRSFIYERAKRGEIELVKMGRFTMVKTESMLAYINSLPPLKSGNP